MSEAPLLEVRQVSKRFGGVHALERVSLSLAAGEVVALAGDNGAGKSTLTKIISGVFPPTEGAILYEGRPVAFARPQDGPFEVTLTSPGSGEGKSFISLNLALAFAEMGRSTILVDGDIRRGTLHRMFGTDRAPGLTVVPDGSSRPPITRRTSTRRRFRCAITSPALSTFLHAGASSSIP